MYRFTIFDCYKKNIIIPSKAIFTFITRAHYMIKARDCITFNSNLVTNARSSAHRIRNKNTAYDKMYRVVYMKFSTYSSAAIPSSSTVTVGLVGRKSDRRSISASRSPQAFK